MAVHLLVTLHVHLCRNMQTVSQLNFLHPSLENEMSYELINLRAYSAALDCVTQPHSGDQNTK